MMYGPWNIKVLKKIPKIFIMNRLSNGSRFSGLIPVRVVDRDHGEARPAGPEVRVTGNSELPA
jgi:hypothetical protein